MDILPTGSLPSGPKQVLFKEKLEQFLISDTSYNRLDMYFYEVTCSGWETIQPVLQQWLEKKKRRTANIYCGLSHWLSEPAALSEMMRVLPRRIRVVQRGYGIFHPKAYVFRDRRRVDCFIGSNNLTRAGMLGNFEMGVRLTVLDTNKASWYALDEWENSVQSISSLLTKKLLAIYEEEYQHMRRLPREHPGVVGKKRARLQATAVAAGLPTPKSVVMEVMPKETGAGGSQLQIPNDVALSFFGLVENGRRNVRIKNVGTGEIADLTLTNYGNHTRRLSIRQLAEVDRPCIIWFIDRGDIYDFDIVSKMIEPSEYERLLVLCPFRTTAKSKRWGMYDSPIF